jgi:hypothetical protein
LKVRLADLGGTLIPGSPADFGKLIADETEERGKVIRTVTSSFRSLYRAKYGVMTATLAPPALILS